MAGHALDTANCAGTENTVCAGRNAIFCNRNAQRPASRVANADLIRSVSSMGRSPIHPTTNTGSLDPSDDRHTFAVPESTAAGAGGLAQTPGDAAAAGPGAPEMQHPILTVHPGGAGHGQVTGEAVLNEIFDLIRHRLPLLDPTDPVRPHLAALAPVLAEELGRPRAVVVPTVPLPG
jgi:hypothetical protein